LKANRIEMMNEVIIIFNLYFELLFSDLLLTPEQISIVENAHFFFICAAIGINIYLIL
jgi:hypothetical protein